MQGPVHRVAVRMSRPNMSQPTRLAPSTPQLLAGKPRALSERFELRPHDRGMDAAMERSLREAAIGAGDDVLAADEPGEPHNPLGDQRRMLDHVGGVADDAWNEHFACR